MRRNEGADNGSVFGSKEGEGEGWAGGKERVRGGGGG